MTLDFVPTLVSAGNESEFKLGSCSDVPPLLCRLKTKLPKCLGSCPDQRQHIDQYPHRKGGIK